MSFVRVDPMLKSIDGGDPGKNGEDAIKVCAARAGGIVVVVEFVQVAAGEQLHAHRGDLAEFDGRAAIRMKILAANRERMEGVAGFVKDGVDIALDTDRIHENKGEP